MEWNVAILSLKNLRKQQNNTIVFTEIAKHATQLLWMQFSF